MGHKQGCGYIYIQKGNGCFGYSRHYPKKKKTGSLMPEQRRRRRRGGGGDGYVWRKILSIRGSRRIVFFFYDLGSKGKEVERGACLEQTNDASRHGSDRKLCFGLLARETRRRRRVGVVA